MSKYSQDKNYIYYENSNVPINKLNIRDLRTLEEKERELLLDGYEHFHKKLTASTIFNERYLKLIHKNTFNPLFDFAGKFRTNNISKGYSTFCQVRFLDQTSKQIFSKLENDNFLKNYSSKTPQEFAKKIAYYLCELTALHPFPEFNGRTIRLFFDLIAIYNGYEYIDYHDALKIEGGQNKFIQASIDCMIGNDKKMYNIILNGLKKAK